MRKWKVNRILDSVAFNFLSEGIEESDWKGGASESGFQRIFFRKRCIKKML